MSIREQRYEEWISGKSFKDLADEYDVKLYTITEYMSYEIGSILGDYCVDTCGKTYGADVCVIKEVDDVIEEYSYVRDKERCRCLIRPGIYKRNEEFFRKVINAIRAKSLKKTGANRYRKIFFVTTFVNSEDDLLDTQRTEARLNKIPHYFKLLSTYNIEDHPYKPLYGIFEVPELTIN